MKSIWWVVGLAVFALIFLLFPLLEVEHVDKELVVGEGTYYEMEMDVQYYNCYYTSEWTGKEMTPRRICKPLTSPVTTYRQVAKTGEVVKVQDISTTEKVGLLEDMWIHTFSTPFSPIAITGSEGKTSETFTVNTKEWLIEWIYVPDPNHPESNSFGFLIYPAEETTLYVESVVLPEETSGSIHSHAGPGEYYVTVEATNIRSWGILIKPA